MKEHFEIPNVSNARRKIILLAGMRWRQFKSNLTTHWAFAKVKGDDETPYKKYGIEEQKWKKCCERHGNPFWQVVVVFETNIYNLFKYFVEIVFNFSQDIRNIAQAILKKNITATYFNMGLMCLTCYTYPLSSHLVYGYNYYSISHSKVA